MKNMLKTRKQALVLHALTSWPPDRHPRLHRDEQQTQKHLHCVNSEIKTLRRRYQRPRNLIVRKNSGKRLAGDALCLRSLYAYEVSTHTALALHYY